MRGIDISTDRLAAIRAQQVDLIPEDITRLREALGSDLFSLHGDTDSIDDCDAVIICVPTPIDRHLAPDLGALRAACRTVVEHARPGQVLVLTSTSYVGTTADLLVGPLRARGLRPGVDVSVAFSPERIDPGNRAFPQHAVPRIVGGVTLDCGARAAAVLELVAPTVHLVSSPESAELAKLYENAFRAVNIAFANEMADVARDLGLDVTEAIEAAATKPYGFMPFTPGPGVGGHCIPCDPHYLLWQLRAQRLRPSLIDEAMAKIASRPGQVVSRAAEVLAERGRPVAGSRVVVVGIAYKPGVQDLRCSPGVEVLSGLQQRGADVSYHDPYCPEVRVGTRTLTSVPVSVLATEPAWDLAVVSTVHPDVDHSWLARVPAVLDASFRLPRSLARVPL